MKKFFIAVCFLATAFDGIAVTLGLAVAAKARTLPAYIFSGVGALVIVALMLSALDIWRKSDAIHRAMRVFWCLAFFVNMAAVFFATGNHIILERSLKDAVSYEWGAVYEQANILQLCTIAVLTVFLTAAPVGVSLFHKFFFVEEEEDEEELGRPTIRGRNGKESEPTGAKATL